MNKKVQNIILMLKSAISEALFNPVIKNNKVKPKEMEIPNMIKNIIPLKVKLKMSHSHLLQFLRESPSFQAGCQLLEEKYALKIKFNPQLFTT